MSIWRSTIILAPMGMLLFVITGCGDTAERKSGGVASETTATRAGELTTQTRTGDSVTTAAEASVVLRVESPFFSERYLPAEDRLRNRQIRVMEVLGTPSYLADEPTTTVKPG